MLRKYPKIGLALGSGGARGLAHIGVLKSLEKHNIPISYIAASSIGSIIGAHYATYQDSKKLEELVLTFSRKQGMGLFDFTIKGGIIKGEKTERFISEILGKKQFHELKIPLAVVATDLNTAAPVIFTSGNLTKAIRGSIAVPAVYQPILYLDKLLGDGGLSNPVPTTIVKDMGADIAIAVNLDHIYVENPLTEIPALLRIPMHAVSILRHNLALHAIQNADVIITPLNKLHIGLLGWNNFFNKEKAMEIIQEGESATDKIIPEIEKVIEEYQKKHSTMYKLLHFFSK